MNDAQIQFLLGLSLYQIQAVTNYGYSTIQTIIHRVANAIIDTIEAIYLRVPQNEDEWRQVAIGFEEDTCLPNCLGSIGKKLCEINLSL